MELPKNPESVSLSLTQTSKGFWYVEKLTSNGGTVEEMLKNLDKLVEETNKRLINLNGTEEKESS